MGGATSQSEKAAGDAHRSAQAAIDDHGVPAAAPDSGSVDRRRMLGTLVAGAAGAIAATTLADSNDAQAAPTFDLNVSNTTTGNTNVVGPGGSVPWSGPSLGLPVVLSVQCNSSSNNAFAARGRDTSDSYAVYGAAAFGVVGIATAANGNTIAPSRGMWGMGSVDGTTGVVAEFRGAVNAAGAPLRIVDTSASSVAPTGGSHLVGEMTMRTGNLWLCVAGGTPGSWVRLAGPATRGSDIRLLDPSPTSDGTAPVTGTFEAGEMFVSNGIAWLCTASGTPGTWLELNPPPAPPPTGNDIRLLDPPPTSDGTAPVSGSFVAGQMFASAGRAWLCTASGTPGSWLNLNPSPPTGNIVPIVPGRVLDTRGGPKLADGEERTVDVSTSTTGLALVPATATGVTYNLAIDGTVGAGFLSVYPAGATWPGTASINWSSAGLILSNSGVSALGPHTSITLRGGVGSTHAIVDVTGYII